MVEFRSSIKNMPQWDRILKRYANTKNIDADFSGAQRGEWNKLTASAKSMQPMEKLQAVNNFFNRWPYRTDLDLYGLVDYWATPAEFIKNSGDCEDYSVTKMFALIQLGLDPAKLRVVILKDRIRNFDHAVLAVYLDDDVYILDNVSPMVLPHSKYGHYRPILSFNLSYRWAHVPPSK
jgi:predicted transglutaminase-like cysteine proteinase